MSDDLPTPERLRRIEQGVSRRIDLRRLVARRIAGGSVAIVLVVGGFALLPHLGLSSGGGSGSSAAGGSASSLVPVECHGTRTTSVRAARAGLPQSALTACAATALSGAAPNANGAGTAPSPSGSLSLGVLCRADDGALEVYLGAAATCAEHDLEPYDG